MKNRINLLFYMIVLILFSYNIYGLQEASIIENDRLFSELKYNDNNGIAIFTINNDIENLRIDSLYLRFNELKGKIKSYDIKIRSECIKTYDENIYKKEIICSKINNSCHENDILDYVIMYNESYECWKDIQYIPIGNNDFKIDNVKFIYVKGSYEIDWIPIIKTGEKIYTQNKWAWWNVSFNNYRNITIKNANSELIDFPVYIHLNNTDNIHNNGSDIRFIYNNTDLSFEIEKFGLNDVDIWVKIPCINLTNITIQLYYNNSDVSDGQDVADVWSNGFIAVYHMSNTSDSANSHTLSAIGTPTITSSSMIGNAYDINAGDVLYPADHDDFSFTDGVGNDQSFTISLWLNVDDLTGGMFIGKYDQGTLAREYSFSQNAEGSVWAGMVETSPDNAYFYRYTANNQVVIGTWGHFTYTYDGSEIGSGIDIYKNGLVIDTSDYTGGTGTYLGMSNTITPCIVGDRWNSYPSLNNLNINGKFDELRWESAEKNQDWINYTYQNIQNQDTFIFISDEYSPFLPNNPPAFNDTIPDFELYIFENINYTDHYHDIDDDNISIYSSCDFLNLTIIDNYTYNIYYYADVINISYCNLSICDYQNCSVSNNFVITVSEIPEPIYNYAFLDLRHRNNIYILAIFIFIYCMIIMLGIYTKNMIIKSFGVILGITIGIILFQIHYILFMIFLFKNILIWLFT